MPTTTSDPTLADELLGIRGNPARRMLMLLGGTLALWISAKLAVPVCPVPITIQTFVVLAIGMAFGMRLACLTLAFYLLEGALGLTVFAGTPEKGIGLL